MENCPFIDDLPVKTSIYKGFSMAMLNHQMVYLALDMLVTLKRINDAWPDRGTGVAGSFQFRNRSSDDWLAEKLMKNS